MHLSSGYLFCACIHFFGRNGWCRSHTKVGSSADECEGVKHSSCKESPAGEEKRTSDGAATTTVSMYRSKKLDGSGQEKSAISSVLPKKSDILPSSRTIAVMTPLDLHLREHHRLHEMFYRRTDSFQPFRLDNGGFFSSRSIHEPDQFHNAFHGSQFLQASVLRSSNFGYSKATGYLPSFGSLNLANPKFLTFVF
ncbi:hypothetical protein B296_00017348 [Ensete ventricosum]|uniref:Uncharacterized protein n=1 Tax=Ensete ventricosum TaxID=4639 RepID=A0A427B119_ENSVE|nr:hypothetical protein B296_00017348 [Ensete ventricosum]